ncbi:MAG TPA: O-methyltransferase [Longimicrobiales bacterium]
MSTTADASDAQPPPDPAALSDYVERLFAREDALLRELREEIGRRGLPTIYISAEVGRLLQVLLAAVGARRVLEIGTLGGYSAIWMARALPPGGRVLSLEIEEAHAAVAREFAKRAGLGDVIEVRVGDALESLPAIAEAETPFDACFIDADKESYPEYLQWARRLVRPGGLILADNAFWSGRVLEPAPRDEPAAAIQRFNRELAEAEDLVSTVVPVRDGLAVAVVGDRERRLDIEE